MPTIWEQRFPTFVGGSPSPSVPRQTTAASLRHAVDFSSVSRVVRPSSQRRRLHSEPVRINAAGRVLSPLHAIRAADDAVKVPIDYSSSSIVPGNPVDRRHDSPATNQHVSQQARTDADTTIQNNYDLFLVAMERAHGRLTNVPLHNRWALLASWIDRLVYDEVGSQKLVEAAGRFYNDAEVSLASTVKPQGLRTAMSFMYLEQLLYIVHQCHPKLNRIAQSIRNDLYEAIYIAPDTTHREELAETFFPMTDPFSPEEQRRLMDRFYRKTYYQKLRELSVRLTGTQTTFEVSEKLKVRRHQTLDRILSRTLVYSERVAFRLWRGYVKGKRQKRQLLLQMRSLETALDRARAELVSHEKEYSTLLSRCQTVEAELAQSKTDTHMLRERNQELEAALRRVASAPHLDSTKNTGLPDSNDV